MTHLSSTNRALVYRLRLPSEQEWDPGHGLRRSQRAPPFHGLCAADKGAQASEKIHNLPEQCNACPIPRYSLSPPHLNSGPLACMSRSFWMSASSQSFCVATETYSPAAMARAQATQAEIPATRPAEGVRGQSARPRRSCGRICQYSKTDSLREGAHLPAS